jgi:DNA-binding transcriptional regulator YiaG
MRNAGKTEPLPFADVVRCWRETRKLSKAAAARKLGVPYRTFQDWEYGNRTPRGFRPAPYYSETFLMG